MKTKILSGLVILALALAVPYGAQAATRAIADTYTIDGITYYNVNSQNFNSDKKFYVDMISAKHSALGGRSLGDLWLIAALGMGKDVFYPTAAPEQFAAQLKQGLLTGESTVGNFHYTYFAPEWSNYDGGYVETSAYFDDYMGYRFMFTVRFSDFTVGALLPADEGLYVSSTTENGSVKNVEASSVKNDTATTVTASQNLTKSITESLTSTVENSSSYSFTEGLKVGFETTANVLAAQFKITGELSTQFTQAFTKGWSTSQGTSTSYQKNSTVSVTLPPYTNVMMKQGDSEATTTTKYNCPVIMGYKVTVIAEGLLGRTYTFGSSNSNARKDLEHRAFDDGAKSLDSQKVDWEYILADSDFKDAIQKITDNAPMSGSGATVTYTTKTTYSEVAGLASLYPLARVELGQNTLSFIDSNNVARMKVGNYSCVDYLNLNGYNSRSTEYYGFDKSKGYWRVVDENMHEISGSNAPVVIAKDSATGQTQFKAVKPGKCYLKYFINEDAYPTGIGKDTYTKNSEIQPALLEINVIDQEVKYEITGEYTGIVGAEPESIEGDDKLTVSAYDIEDLEIDREYIWQARQKASKGIQITPDGIVTFTKPRNDFQVRVKDQNGSVYSEWVIIKAEVLGDDTTDYDSYYEEVTPTEYAEKGTTFMFTGKYVGGVSNDRESIEGSGKLKVEAYDSTGQELNVLYSWEAKDDSDGMTLTEDGQVSFTKTGLYYVRVKSGPVYSAWIEIHANQKAPARLMRIPTPTGNTYTGESVDILASDVTCEGGTAVYALGSDDITAPDAYSSEMPQAVKAGTYYVWCKVLGDADHDNSEPVCITAEIVSASYGGDDFGDMPGEDSPATSIPGSSGGGCNAGIPAFCFGLIAAAWLLGRKEH